jgi:hypothetical protein
MEIKITKLSKIRNYSSVDDLLESTSRGIEKFYFEKDEFLYISDKKILDVSKKQEITFDYDWSNATIGLDLTK